MFARSAFAALAATLLSSSATAQTYTSCNPLTTTCNPDTALGMTIDVDFTQGAVNSFTASGSPSYSSANGVQFQVAKAGDSPQLTSVFYIMFGRVEFSLKAATGNGIVSSFVLQSDDLDEIDLEWLGYDGGNVQTNYFGKGITGAYDRGQINPIANNQNQFIDYVIDWTSDRIVWTAGGTVLRTLNAADAETNQYPQTPMMIKMGAWSGGDSSNNNAGTVSWAHGPTVYSNGPFNMYVKNLKVTDYSTGKQYKYGDQSGSWQSIQAVGGTINGNKNGAGGLTTTAGAAKATGTATSVVGGIATGTGSSTNSGVPAGWTMTSSGRILPISSSTSNPLISSSSLSPASSTPSSASAASAPSSTTATPAAETPTSAQATPTNTAGGDTVITTYDGRGFLTTMTVPAGFSTQVKTYDSQGFQVFPTAAPAAPMVEVNSAGTGVVKVATSESAPALRAMASLLATLLGAAAAMLL